MRGAKGGHLQAVRSLGIRASVGKGGEGTVSFCLREIGQIRYWAVSNTALSLLPIQPSSSPVKLPSRGSQEPGHQTEEAGGGGGGGGGACGATGVGAIEAEVLHCQGPARTSPNAMSALPFREASAQARAGWTLQVSRQVSFSVLSE